MEHHNPLLTNVDTSSKFITIGEILLRLTPLNYENIHVANHFQAAYGGTEANVAVNLANLGVDATFFSVVPNTSLGDGAIRTLRSNKVHCTPVILSTPEETPTHRLGTCYLETDCGIQGSRVFYDRKHSALTEYDLSKVDADLLLDGFTWLHLSSVTPALSKSCADFILKCLKTAKAKGLTVSFDSTFCSSLWTLEEAQDYCTMCLPYVDVLIGIEPDHLQKDGSSLQPSCEEQEQIFRHFIHRYPNIGCIARHVRHAHSNTASSLKAFLWYQGHTFESKMYTSNILDCMGGGDAFASGLIYAMMNHYEPMDMVNFAAASSVISHTFPSDNNITVSAESIKAIMNMNFDIK